MTTDTAILDRLRKLMDLSTSSNEHEARLAATRATELMTKHQITLADLTAHTSAQQQVVLESGRVDDEDSAPCSHRCEAWHLTLLSYITLALGGRGWRQQNRRAYMFYMMGPPDTVNAARYIYMQLERTISRLARAEMKSRNESNSWRRAYSDGMAVNVGARLLEQRKSTLTTASSTAMVHISRTDEAINEAMKSKGLNEIKSRGTQTPNARYEGYRDGKHVELPSTDSLRITAAPKELK